MCWAAAQSRAALQVFLLETSRKDKAHKWAEEICKKEITASLPIVTIWWRRGRKGSLSSRPPASCAPEWADATASPPQQLTAALIQSRLSADPYWKEAIFLECISKKQLTGLAQLFLEMFNRSSSGRECWLMELNRSCSACRALLAPSLVISWHLPLLCAQISPTASASPPTASSGTPACVQPALNQSGHRTQRAGNCISLLAALPWLSCAARTIAAWRQMSPDCKLQNCPLCTQAPVPWKFCAHTGTGMCMAVGSMGTWAVPLCCPCLSPIQANARDELLAFVSCCHLPAMRKFRVKSY